MTLLRTLRSKKVIAYGLLTLSLIYLLSDRVTQLLCLSDQGSAASAWCSSSVKEPPWNIFYHLGGNGPWITKHSALGQADDPLPDGCAVDQVHMMSRHGERYPTRNAGRRHLALLDKLEAASIKLSGPLEFLNTWTYFTNAHDPAFENLTASGPYAGTTQARDTGRRLRNRYSHLVPTDRALRFWSCSSPRDVETARYFADGFFGPDWEDDGSAILEIIPETPEQQGNTLTPGDTCLKYRDDLEFGHDYGYGKLETWQNHFAAPIAKRLSTHASGLDISPLEVYGMMEMCGFEILARGSSPWCDVFTHEEWRQFEYGRDLLHFYRAGPGNKYAQAMGWLYLNATADLLQNASSHDVYLSFVHDGDIVPLLAALEILNEKGKQELPTNHVKVTRNWQTSDVVPMGGRLLFERISCDKPGHKISYVRLSINDGVAELPGSSSTTKIPYAVDIDTFWIWVSSRLKIYGEYADVCKLPSDAADRITFLHQ